MKDLALMVRKLERKQKDSYQFKNTGIAKQEEILQKAGVSQEWARSEDCQG